MVRILDYAKKKKLLKLTFFSKLNNNIYFQNINYLSAGMTCQQTVVQMQLQDKLTKAFIQINALWSFQLGFCLCISDHVKNSKITQTTWHLLMYQRFSVEGNNIYNLSFKTFFTVILDIHLTQVPQKIFKNICA